MDKLLLTLTIVTFSTGVLCNVAPNLTDTANPNLDPLGEIDNTENNTASSKHNLADTADSTLDPLGETDNAENDTASANAEQILHDSGAQDMMSIANYIKTIAEPEHMMGSQHSVGSLRASNGVNTCRPTYHLPSGYMPTQNIGAHKLHTRKMSWNKARKSCMAEGGELAIINSDEEAAILTNWLGSESLKFAWLGIHNYFDEDEWVTLSGEMLETTGYENWSTRGNQPDNKYGNENCALLVTSGGMADTKCTQLHSYFCKINIC